MHPDTAGACSRFNNYSSQIGIKFFAFLMVNLRRRGLHRRRGGLKLHSDALRVGNWYFPGSISCLGERSSVRSRIFDSPVGDD